MLKLPALTVLIPTYARTVLLAEAIASALAQDYKGEVSIVVFNDCARQFLTCTDPRVMIINSKERCSSLGAKRDKMLWLDLGRYGVWLDDDDILMPWHLSNLARWVRPGPELVGAVLCRNLIRHHLGQWSWGPTPGGINGILVETAFAKALGGFDRSLDVGEDNAFRAKLLERPKAIAYAPQPSYVYRVDAPTLHISQSLRGTKVDASLFTAHADRRMDEGIEPTGEIVITPWMQVDYAKEFRTRFPGDCP